MRTWIWAFGCHRVSWTRRSSLSQHCGSQEDLGSCLVLWGCEAVRSTYLWGHANKVLTKRGRRGTSCCLLSGTCSQPWETDCTGVCCSRLGRIICNSLFLSYSAAMMGSAWMGLFLYTWICTWERGSCSCSVACCTGLLRNIDWYWCHIFIFKCQFDFKYLLMFPTPGVWRKLLWCSFTVREKMCILGILCTTLQCGLYDKLLIILMLCC